MLRRWGMTSIARRLNWTLFSAVDRISLAKRWFCVKIWRRAASLMLRRGPCGCFIELCAVTCTDCCLSCLRHLSCLDEIPLSAKLLLATSLRPNTWQNPARRTKEMLASLLRARWICYGTAMRSPSKRFPRYDCFEGTWSKKMRFSLFSKFYLNRSQMRANVFYSSGKDFNGSVVILVHEARHVLSTRQLERP